MNRKSINAVIILGIISLSCILFIQIFWIRKTIHAQQVAVAIQQKEDSLTLIQFGEHAHSALRDVLEQITKQKELDLYGAVRQVSPNYFVVDISEELDPFYLETLLKREFDSRSLNQDFQYGIYDCYSDSIVFGNIIKYHKKEGYSTHPDTLARTTKEKLKWKNDGHYFTVIFPNVKARPIGAATQLESPWFYFVILSALLLVFFGVAMSIILRQKRLSEVKTDFINNMTHELKTPISTIGLSSELLLRGDFTEDPERLKRYAEIIYKENKRLENQVERVLNVAKLDKDKLVLKKESLSMHELILDAKESFDLNQTENGGVVHLELNAREDCIVVDPVHITNVIYNLIDNAVKYTEVTPEITIRTENQNGGLLFSIQDNGIGIRREDQKMIFDKFFRVPTGNLHNVKGFGLGLYYVKLIVEEHGGKISIKSALHKGTTFNIWFPAGSSER